MLKNEETTSDTIHTISKKKTKQKDHPINITKYKLN